MITTNEGIDYVIDIMATQLADRIVKQKGLSQNEAIKYLLSTKTYKLLIEKKSKLYAESVEYVLDMLDAEEKGDIARILEV